MHIAHAGLLFCAAVVAGATNSVAGGGSFVSFPTLLFIGIPPVNANATNTVALWPGQVASIGAYRGELEKLPWRQIMPLLITGILGGILGAWVLLKTPQNTFLRLVPWLLLIATPLETVVSNAFSAFMVWMWSMPSNASIARIRMPAPAPKYPI